MEAGDKEEHAASDRLIDVLPTLQLYSTLLRREGSSPAHSLHSFTLFITFSKLIVNQATKNSYRIDVTTVSNILNL